MSRKKEETMNDDYDLRVRFGLDIKDSGSYSAESSFRVFPDQGDTELGEIGRQLNAFLRQAGYVRNGDCMLMESLTEDELWHLEDCLAEYRGTGSDGASGQPQGAAALSAGTCSGKDGT